MRTSLSAASALSLLALAQASPYPHGKIEWGPCDKDEFNTTLTLQCGSIPVPLDYTSKNSTTFDLGVVKIPAAKGPSRGSILTNFGGPGEEARQTAVLLGSTLGGLSGGVYDILAFDPRGVGKTIPFECTDNFYYVGQIQNEERSVLESDQAAERLFLRGKVDGSICQHLGNGNKTGEYIGTAATARDFISVVDALGEDGLLRYWGFSYGTTLGATLAAMFPERIDKMIIDGVQNAAQYYHEHGDYEEWADTDMVFSHFFDTCVAAGADVCPLAAFNKTARELEDDTYALFDKLATRPIQTEVSLVNLSLVKGYLLGGIKAYPQWPDMAAVLATLLYGTDAERSAVALAASGGVLPDEGPTFQLLGDAVWAIHGADRLVRATTFDEFKPVIERLRKTSRFIGDSLVALSMRISQWPYHAKEVYTGDFRVKTKNPILVSTNVYDAHTPIRSAKNATATFEGSGLLVVNGTGHTTLNVPSLCGFHHTSAYWLHGDLPKAGNVCDAFPEWSGLTWEDAFKAAANSSANSTSN